jgi:hypothetical protein
MQSAGSVLVVMAGLILLYLLISGKMDAAVATWKAAVSGVPQTTAAGTPGAVTGALPSLPSLFGNAMGSAAQGAASAVTGGVIPPVMF